MKRHSVWMLVLVIVLLLAACQPAVPAQQGGETPAVETPAARGYAELLEQLRGEGAAVEEGEAQQESFFSVSGRNITVNGMTVTVYEFADPAAREAASATISGNGFIIGTASVDWIDQPNFWAADRLIVLYVGQDAATIELLNKLLGERLTGAQPEPVTGPEGAAYVMAARSALALELGKAESEVAFVSAQAAEWTDSCLGLGGPAESCLQALTPGFDIRFSVDGTEYAVRTNEDGSAVRIAK